jgi:hypothetical protein
LEYVNGIKTDNPHNCPNRKQESNPSINTSAVQPTQMQDIPKKEDEVEQLINVLISRLNVLIQARQKGSIITHGNK